MLRLDYPVSLVTSALRRLLPGVGRVAVRDEVQALDALPGVALLLRDPARIDWVVLSTLHVPGSPEVSHGRDGDLAQHLMRLRREFAGSSELAFAHAALVVLIRRGIALPTVLSRYRMMWGAAGSLLCRQLSLRWLTSAADTFVDHGQDGEERSTAMLASAIAGLVKIYETERFATGEADVRAERIAALQTNPVVLIGGLTGFAVGSGDMILNLVNRLRCVAADGGTPAHLVLDAILGHVLRGPSALSRLRLLHRREATRWSDGADG